MGAKGSTHASDGKVFTLEKLAQFDGTTMPSYIAILGKVYDVSESSNFQAGGGYGDLWAGCDCTYALATLSLDKEDANRLDWEMSQFSEQQVKALAAWKSYFDQKYEVVGVLAEYEGRNIELPEIATAAQVQLPGISGGDGIAAGKTPPVKVRPCAPVVGEAPRVERL
ncbi:unnamed protein product [Cladocopium goreaui]|uniref:Steroid-binding protein 3 n=1 Tax=Cladocopium goreaui TaxID=2562237 RepID=A0A9P1FGI4_9DINO|nr:unnamed protein product [Cladocopium goreaui]